MSFTFASRQRALRGACALTLAGTMLLPAAPLFAVNTNANPGVAVAAEQNQTAGSINWGIKASFRSYIGEPYKVSEGASYNATDLFTFPNQQTTVSEDGNQVSIQGSGKVQYISHCADRNKPEECPLNLTLSNPRIEVDAAQSTGTLYMTVRTKNYTSGQWEGPHEIPMAKLSLKTAQQSEKDGVVTWSNVATNLTPEGNHAFSNFYDDGAGLDALTFSYPGTKAKGAQDSGFTLGESTNSGTDISDPQNTVRAGSHLFYAAGKRFGGGADARYVIADSKTLQQTESATLPMGSSAHFAANPATGDIVFVNANTRALERYRVDDSGKLVSQGTFAGVTFDEAEKILALGYNQATNSWGVLAADSSGQARYVSVASDGAVNTQTVKSPLDFDPSVAKADDLSEYYGDTFTGSTRILAPLPDGSFVYSPNKAIYDEEGNKIQNAQLLHLSAQGISVVEQTQPKDAEEADSLNGLLTTPDGYIYRWNNYAPSASAVQVLKYDGSSFTTVRESAAAPHGMGAIASFFSAGDKIVAVDAANGRLVWMSKTLDFDHDVPLSDLRSTDKTGSYNAFELPNGDIIFPTMVEKNDGLESNLWLNRLVNTAKKAEAEQPKPADPEPAQPAPEPSSPAETPAPAPSESSEPPAPEPAQPASDARILQDVAVDWGLKASFRRYITGPVARGTQTLTGNITTNPDGSYHFSAPEGTVEADGSYRVAFTGSSVAYTGHHGVLDVSVRDLEVVIKDGQGSLYANVSERPYNGNTAPNPVVEHEHVLVGTFDASSLKDDGGQLTLTPSDATKVKLSAEATPIFAGFYQEGQELDAFGLSAQVVTKPAPEQPKPADPEPEPSKPADPEPTPEPSKPVDPAPTPEPTTPAPEPTNPAPEPSKPADPAPTPEPTKPVETPAPSAPADPAPEPSTPAPTAPAPEPSSPVETPAPAPSTPANPEPSKPADPAPEPTKPAEPAKSFSDVHEGDMFYREINWLAGQNITTGWVDGTFRPHESIERAAIAAFFYRMSGSPEVQLPKESPFTDVKEGDPFYKEIVWFHQQGITTGWPDGTFRPHDPVSREAMAAFFYRYAGKPSVEVRNAPFKDVPAQNMFYREIAWLRESKITTGWNDGTFRPHESISREAMAAFLYRYAHRG